MLSEMSLKSNPLVLATSLARATIRCCCMYPSVRCAETSSLTNLFLKQVGAASVLLTKSFCRSGNQT
jgi:hypothetical protein